MDCCALGIGLLLWAVRFSGCKHAGGRQRKGLRKTGIKSLPHWWVVPVVCSKARMKESSQFGDNPHVISTSRIYFNCTEFSKYGRQRACNVLHNSNYSFIVHVMFRTDLSLLKEHSGIEKSRYSCCAELFAMCELCFRQTWWWLQRYNERPASIYGPQWKLKDGRCQNLCRVWDCHRPF